MKALIAILSCHVHRHFQQAQRETWIKILPAEVDYKFVLGNPIVDAEPDEIFFDTSDDYRSSVYKSYQIVKWALENGYDYVFECDTDTMIIPKKLMSSGFEQYDYYGGGWTYASGGSGFWLSVKAMKALLEEPILPDGPPHDIFTAETMKKHNIPFSIHDGYEYAPGWRLHADTVTYHLGSVFGWAGTVPPYTPSMMYENWNLAKQMGLV